MCHILINRLAYRFRGRFTVSAGNLSYFPIVFPIFLIVVYQLEAEIKATARAANILGISY